MEKLTVNPQNVHVNGNFITDQHGYIEDIVDFESYKCTITPNSTVLDGWNNFNIYSFSMNMEEGIYNYFSDAIQYCESSCTDSLFICEHLEDSLTDTSDYFEVLYFRNGIFLKVKSEYVEAGAVDFTQPFFLLIHQDNTGVEIPADTSKIRFTSTYTAKNTITDIRAGFVFFDNNGDLIEYSVGENIVNEGTGTGGRLNIATSTIPANAKYVSVEFQFPEGLNNGDYFSLQLNCLLFNNDYEGFIKNNEEIR